MCAAEEVESVKTAVSHRDRTLARDDVNGALVKMRSPSDNSAELKGQSCHSRGEHEAEQCSEVERSEGGCRSSQIQNTQLTVQVSHVESTALIPNKVEKMVHRSTS